MKYDNFGVLRRPNGACALVIALEPDVVAKMGHFIADDEMHHRRDKMKCVIPEYDRLQSVPLIRRHESGYNTALGCVLSYLTGWHFIWQRLLPHVRPYYYANSEGMRLIAQYGDPHKAYASL